MFTSQGLQSETIVSALHQDPAPSPLQALFKSNGATTQACRRRAPKVGFRTLESANIAVNSYATDSSGFDAADGTRAGTPTGSNARTAPGEARAAASDSSEARAAASDSTGSGTGAAPGTGAAAADGTEKFGGCRCGGGYGGGIGTRSGRAAVADGFNEDGGVGQQQLDAPCGTDSGGGDSRNRRDIGDRCGANDGECSDGFGF